MDPADSLPKDPSDELARRKRRLRSLSFGVRVLLFLVGWTLVLVGVAGLVLPGIQGILTILLGAAVLSLVSEMAYELMRASLRRWPTVWNKVEDLRTRIHRRLSPRRDGPEEDEEEEEEER